MPTRPYDTDLAYDLYAADHMPVLAHKNALIPTGIAIELPPAWGALIKDRSSLGLQGLHVYGGVVDPGYRGELLVDLWNATYDDFQVNRGDKIAQLVPIPATDFKIQIAKELSSTERGGKGHGSSGSR